MSRACVSRSSSTSRSGRLRRRSARGRGLTRSRSEEHTSELQSRLHLVCRLLLEKKTQDRAPARTPYAPPTLAPDLPSLSRRLRLNATRFRLPQPFDLCSSLS